MSSDAPGAELLDPCKRPPAAPIVEPGPVCCRYCGQSNWTGRLEGVQDRLHYVPGSWDYRRCGGCGSLALAPLPGPEQLASFYPPTYCYSTGRGQPSRWKRWLSKIEYDLLYRPLYRADARRVLRAMGSRPGSGRRLLDLGCGSGLRLLAMRDLGFEVAGLDFQPGSVEYVRRELGIEASCCDLDRLADHLADRTYDVITAYYVLEHLPDPRKLVEDSLRALRPGGWFVGAVPLADSLQASWFGRHWTQIREAPRHLTIPSRAGLKRLGEVAGGGSVAVLADSARLGAASLALTLFPRATAHAAYGQSGALAAGSRLLGAAAAACAVPWCWLENTLVGRPACGLLLVGKPEEQR